jgi:REP element-mobilizing transposase RayT
LHVWFSTKGRKAILVEEIRLAVLGSFKATAARLGVRILQQEAIEDHVHMLLVIPGNLKLADVMHDLKGRCAREVFQRYPDLPLDMQSNSLWQKSYGWRLVPQGQLEAVRRYIATQADRPFRHE